MTIENKTFGSKTKCRCRFIRGRRSEPQVDADHRTDASADGNDNDGVVGDVVGDVLDTAVLSSFSQVTTLLKLFSSSLTLRQDKLECLCLIFFMQIYYLKVRSREW